MAGKAEKVRTMKGFKRLSKTFHRCLQLSNLTYMLNMDAVTPKWVLSHSITAVSSVSISSLGPTSLKQRCEFSAWTRLLI